jgi:hypothetical protein
MRTYCWIFTQQKIHAKCLLRKQCGETWKELKWRVGMLEDTTDEEANRRERDDVCDCGEEGDTSRI